MFSLFKSTINPIKNLYHKIGRSNNISSLTNTIISKKIRNLSTVRRRNTKKKGIDIKSAFGIAIPIVLIIGKIYYDYTQDQRFYQNTLDSHIKQVREYRREIRKFRSNLNK